MKNETQLPVDGNNLISYDSFIYNYQFQRKISPGWFLLTRRGILIIIGIILSGVFLDGNIRHYAISGFVALLVYSYVKNKNLFTSKISIIDGDGWSDDKNKSILVFSKLSWAQKKYYNTLNKKI